MPAAATASAAATTAAASATGARGDDGGGQQGAPSQYGALCRQGTERLRQAQVERNLAVHHNVHETLASQGIVLPLGLHDAAGKFHGRRWRLRAGSCRDDLRAGGTEEVRLALCGVGVGLRNLESKRGKPHLLPLLRVFIDKERALRQVGGGGGDRLAVGVDDVDEREDIVEHRDVAEGGCLGGKADKRRVGLDGQDVQLRAGRVAVLNQLAAAYLAGDCQALRADGGFHRVLPAWEGHTQGGKFLIFANVGFAARRRGGHGPQSYNLLPGVPNCYQRPYLKNNWDPPWRRGRIRRNMAKDFDTDAAARDKLLAEAFRHNEPQPEPTDADLTSAPTRGELDLEERDSFRRVNTTMRAQDTTDVYEVEYRKLRLEQIVLVGVWTEGTAAEIEAAMAELAALAETAGADVVEMIYQKRDRPDPGTYIGSGKVDELRTIVAATGADTVVCDGELNPGQLTALERALNIKVIDRTMLILDIFAQHAKSKEGKAQVSLAQLEYLYTHTRGWGDTLSRQAGGRAGSNGGVGLRGPGETKIESDRRHIRSEMARLRAQLRGMKTAREVKRSRRQNSVTPQIAIAGYTNAGKSSLLNAITDAGVLVEDALFATLDPTTRRAALSDGREVVFTDTVGFVRHLPTQLVEAFKSTLEEVLGADLVLHVVDGSDPFPLKQIKAVNKVISDIAEENGANVPPEILVINKLDQADDLVIAELRHALGSDNAVFVSAKTGEAIDELSSRIEYFLNSLDEHVHLLIPYTRGDAVSRVHTHGTVLAEEYRTDGTYLDARVPSLVARELAEFSVAD